ncbi:hypothetical protein CYY_004962 [Polysphondylium violaceum]|uniref:CorA family magnesium ion transporterr n=1 Tax=Polysphondylium violaceum TaxID=133409 RepID=A0A8J4PVX7_9MYCE|nr:hypothetical protein CYY_004962 [Polysphondylium violaceum]
MKNNNNNNNNNKNGNTQKGSDDCIGIEIEILDPTTNTSSNSNSNSNSSSIKSPSSTNSLNSTGTTNSSSSGEPLIGDSSSSVFTATSGIDSYDISQFPRRDNIDKISMLNSNLKNGCNSAILSNNHHQPKSIHHDVSFQNIQSSLYSSPSSPPLGSHPGSLNNTIDNSNNLVVRNIKIINNQDDVYHQYSLSEFMDFSKELLESRKESIKGNLSSYDLQSYETSSNHLHTSTPKERKRLSSHQYCSPINTSTSNLKNSTNQFHYNSHYQQNANHHYGNNNHTNQPGYFSPYSHRSSSSSTSPSGAKEDKEKVYWIDLENLSEEEILNICILYSIHHLTFEDITTNDSSEKCEEFSNYTFISTTETTYHSSELVQSSIFMVCFNTYILVFHQNPLESFDHVRDSFRYLEDAGIPSTCWVISSFFDAFNELYSFYIDNLMGEVNVLDEFTLNGEVAQHELYVRLGKATRKSTNLLSWIFIKSDILSALIRQSKTKESMIFLSNIKDRTIRLKLKIKLAEELLSNINSTYISRVSLVLNEESHLLNISMRKFSSMTLIFMPLNLIAALMGMNVLIPGFVGDNDNYHGFIGIITVMMCIGCGLAMFFKKLDWL